MGDPGGHTGGAASSAPHGTLAALIGEWVDLLVVVAAKVAVSALHLRAGFVALSDDDFSRVVIAERFAVAPSFDPSGTSWLPLPFWLTGSAMVALGRSLPVARGAAVLLGVVAALLVHRAARWMGASRAGAVLGAVLATTIPTAARLGASFQPEALTAGLVVLGAAATLLEGPRRLAGALALALACLCRYDAWPAAAAFAALCLLDRARGRAGEPASPTASSGAVSLGLAALGALAAPVAWVVHGLIGHGDALFFVHRVAAYRHALGVTESWSASVAAYPVLLVAREPELTLGALAVLAVAGLARRDGHDGRDRADERGGRGAVGRPAIVLASVLGFLLVGRLLDGAPTHHAERTLLPLWAGLALAASDAGVWLLRSGPPRAAFGALFLTAVSGAAGAAIRHFGPPPDLAPRTSERAIGEVARETFPRALPRSFPAGSAVERTRLLVDTPDYGYFAVIAAFGAPELAAPFDSRDPRDQPLPDAFASAGALRARLTEEHATALVAEHRHWQMAAEVGRLVATRSDFALVDVREPPQPEHLPRPLLPAGGPQPLVPPPEALPAPVLP